MTATLVNTAAVLVGGMVGILFKGKIGKQLAGNIIKAIGLCVCVIGISGALQGDFLLLVVSMALGAFTGELLRIDDGLNKMGGWLQKKFSSGADSSFSEGFISATLLFCVGAMTIVGSIESGLNGNRDIIFTKSVLDGISAMILASALGFGVLFSAAVVLIFQGSLEVFAVYLQALLNDGLIVQFSAAGSIMILAIGINMVFDTKIKAANLLPGFVFSIAYYYISTLIK